MKIDMVEAILTPADAREMADAVVSYVIADDDDVNRSRQANALVASFVKLQQIEIARDTLTFQMARELSESPSDLLRLLRIVAPDAPIVRALTPELMAPEVEDVAS